MGRTPTPRRIRRRVEPTKNSEASRGCVATLTELAGAALFESGPAVPATITSPPVSALVRVVPPLRRSNRAHLDALWARYPSRVLCAVGLTQGARAAASGGLGYIRRSGAVGMCSDPWKLLRHLVFRSLALGLEDRATVSTGASLESCTGSLVHDDTSIGRSASEYPTVHACGWDVALIVGDTLREGYALRLSAEAESSRSVSDRIPLCDGEPTSDFATDEPDRAHTSSVGSRRVAVPRAAGAAPRGVGSEHVAALGAFGTKLGLAFPMTDDLWIGRREPGR